jgi:hypothetical protein
MTRGLRPMLEFAPSFFLNALPSASGADVSAGVLSRRADVLEASDAVSSSSSMPNDSFALPATLRFFLKTGFGVDVLYFAN